VAMQRWMQVFSTRKEKKAHLHDPSNSGSANKRLPCRRPLDPRCHQSMGRRPDESGATLYASHGSYWPTYVSKLPPIHVGTRTALRTHLIATWRKHNHDEPSQGSSDPTSRPNHLCSVHPGLPRVSSWLVPRRIPRVLAVPHEVVQPL
jgi:hypothetical protein